MNLIDDITKLQLIYLQKAHKTREKHEKPSFQKYFFPFYILYFFKLSL